MRSRAILAIAAGLALAACGRTTAPPQGAGAGQEFDNSFTGASVPVSDPDPVFYAASVAPDRVLVKYFDGATSEDKAAARGKAEATPEGELDAIGVEVLRVPEGRLAHAIKSLRNLATVEYAEPDAISPAVATIPNDPYFPTGSGSYYGGQWDKTVAHAPSAWDVAQGSSSVLIAVIDSGIASHPDLVGNLVTGWNVLSANTDTSDSNGHGTQVAGVAAASGNNATGIAGVCWTCKILPVKITTGGTAYNSDMASGITWAADHGARVINVSFAGTTSSSTIANAVSYAQSKGAIVVAAAGNNGNSTQTFPASLPGVISVAATNNTDGLQGYSTYGAWVDIAAPAGALTTNLKDPSTGAQWGYMPVGGTSMAAPFTAGTIGLLLSASPTATNDQIIAAILGTTAPLASGTVSTGRIDVGAAMASLGNQPAQDPAPTTLLPPQNLAAPEITGTVRVGQVLSASTGSWSNSPSSFAFQWLRCSVDGSQCQPVADAVASTYTVSSADLGSTLAVTVSASNSAGSSSSTSAATGVVYATYSFSGSLTQKVNSRSFNVALGRTTSGRLSFSSTCAGLSLSISGVASASGPSVLPLDVIENPGDYNLVVRGTCKTSFTLSVTTK